MLKYLLCQFKAVYNVLNITDFSYITRTDYKSIAEHCSKMLLFIFYILTKILIRSNNSTVIIVSEIKFSVLIKKSKLFQQKKALEYWR